MNIQELTAFNSLIEACICIAASQKSSNGDIVSNAWRAAHAATASSLADLMIEFGPEEEMSFIRWNQKRCHKLKEIFISVANTRGATLENLDVLQTLKSDE